MLNTRRLSLLCPIALQPACRVAPNLETIINHSHNSDLNAEPECQPFGRTRRMLRPRNISRRAGMFSGNVAAALAALLALALAAPVTAQPPEAPAESASPPAPGGDAPGSLGAPLVDWSHAEHAHRLVETWLRAGEVDREGLSPVRVTNLVGCRVTLRTNGFLIAMGDAVRPDVEAVVGQPGPPVDVVELVAQATEAALAELTRTLQDAELRARQDPALRRILEERPDARTLRPTPASIADRVLVDVQLARRLEPITIRRGAPPEAVFAAFAPGFHGLRSGRGMIWPASALAANTSPNSQLVQLLDAINRRPEDVIVLGRPGGPPLQRFEVLHVVRPSLGLAPVRLTRGNVVLPPLAIDGRTLESLADQLAEHLKGRFTHDGLIRGTYHPTSNRYEPMWANAQEAALACYALARYSRNQLVNNPRDMIAQNLAIQVVATVRRLAAGGEGAAAAGPSAGALLLLTLLDTDLPAADDPQLRDALGAWLMGLRHEGGGFRDPSSEKNALLNDAEQALVTAALAALYERTRDARIGEAVQASLDELWSRAEGSPNIAALPWFIAAQNRAGDLLARDDASRQSTLARRRDALGGLVDRLTRQQVIEPPLLGPHDVVGGFELVHGPPGAPPNPDWRTAQLLSFLAQALHDPAIVEGHNRFDWLITGGLAARFLAQLMMAEPSCFYARSPADALRGVRLALWDNRQSVSATAVSLLAVTQLQEATRRVTLPEADAGGS